MRASVSRLARVGAIAFSLFGIVMGDWLSAQDKARFETVVVDLVNPCGVAAQPETDYVFLSSRFGIYRYDPSYKKPEAHNAFVEIDGYPDHTDFFGTGTKYEIGPLGLAFLDKDHLVVGDGSRKLGQELVRVYKIPSKPPSTDDWIKEDAALYTLGPIKAGKDSAKGEGNFYGVTSGAGAIWVTCNGDDTKGWIAKSDLKQGKPDPLKPAIATKAATQVDAPGPITFTPDGKELVVGQMGRTDVDAADSLLTFYDPAAGSLKRKLPTGLLDISGLGYSPKTGKLYATDFAWAKPEQGGLFELVIEGDTVKSTKIASLDKPSALAFSKEGHLYVTAFGTAKAPADKSKPNDPGALLYFQPGL